MGCTDCAHDHEAIFAGRWYSYPPLRNALVAGVIAAITFALARADLLPDVVETVAWSVAIVLGGYYWVREGFEELIFEREISIDVLMVAATVGSIILGMWDEAAALVVLYAAAEGLEHYTYARTRRSIDALLDLAPRQATLLADGQQVTVAADELQTGDVFLVKPGEALATDGTVTEGRSYVNEAAVTGEPMPVSKGPGDDVFAGTLNGDGALQIEATASFEDNTLARIIHLVEEAHERKAERQLFIERFGRWYTPAVLIAAALLAAIPAALGGDVAAWATRAVVLLVAAAPCALIMSTPVGIAAGIGRAGKTGILVKGGAHLEDLGRVRVVAFDKTGTLTEGRPFVNAVVPLAADEAETIRVAASLEQMSEHPLATAILAHAVELGTPVPQVTDFEALPGAGVRGVVEGREYFIGSHALCLELGFDVRHEERALEFQQQGNTVVCVSTREETLGLIAISDRIRPRARQAIDELHAMGIETAMLTGDNEATAAGIAAELGIVHTWADLTPEDKTDAVRELVERHGAVAVVGDGINDAPALAEALVGIAMGAAGTDAAIEAADTALMADDLTKVPTALRIGRRTTSIGTQNIVFSLIVLAVMIPAAVGGYISVAVAVLLHEASELLAVANGLRVGMRGRDR